MKAKQRIISTVFFVILVAAMSWALFFYQHAQGLYDRTIPLTIKKIYREHLALQNTLLLTKYGDISNFDMINRALMALEASVRTLVDHPQLQASEEATLLAQRLFDESTAIKQQVDQFKRQISPFNNSTRFFTFETEKLLQRPEMEEYRSLRRALADINMGVYSLVHLPHQTGGYQRLENRRAMAKTMLADIHQEGFKRSLEQLLRHVDLVLRLVQRIENSVHLLLKSPLITLTGQLSALYEEKHHKNMQQSLLYKNILIFLIAVLFVYIFLLVLLLRRHAEQLRSSEQRYELAIKGAQEGLWDWNIVEKTVFYSPNWFVMLGYKRTEMNYDEVTWQTFLHPEEKQRVVNAMVTAIKGDSHYYHNEYRMRHKDGTWCWVQSRALILRDSDGSASRMVGSHTEITRRKQAEALLREEKEKTVATLNAITSGIITVNEASKITYINPGACVLTDWGRAAALEQPVGTVFNIMDSSGDDFISVKIMITRAENNPSTEKRVLSLRTRTGKKRLIELRGAPLFNREGERQGMVFVFDDITEIHRMQQQIEYHATHDMLTGLKNRYEFERRLNETLLNFQPGEQHVVCYLDLNRFKVINDSCGHATGDEVLKNIAKLLITTIRQSDLLARIGGDEFALLLSNCPMNQAIHICSNICTTLEEYRFSWNHKIFDIGISIGITSMNQPGSTLQDVLNEADSACYQAKEKGNNSFYIYCAEDPSIQQKKLQSEWVPRIHEALENDHFQLYAQRIKPIHNADEKGLYMEVLLRLYDHENDKIIVPDHFLPVAERYHLMSKIDTWVLNNTLKALVSISDNVSVYKGSVNLSAITLHNANIVDVFKRLIDDSGIDPRVICFEVTETMAIQNLDVAIALINELKAFGCRFALDDFGSGMASFYYLKRLPVDYVKIDGSLIHDICTNEASRAMVEATHHVAKTMKIQTIAEFVETQAIYEVLNEIGVDFVQGFYIHEPEPIASLLKKSLAQG